MIIELHDQNFHSEVLDCDGPVVVEFGAEWCGPCHIIGPGLKQLSEDFEDTVKFGRVDVDHQIELRDKFGVRYIPTILFFKKGEAVDQLTGTSSKREIRSKIELLLSGKPANS